MIDDNAQNFLFDRQGKIVSWIDPVMVWPPKGTPFMLSPP